MVQATGVTEKKSEHYALRLRKIFCHSIQREEKKRENKVEKRCDHSDRNKNGSTD